MTFHQESTLSHFAFILAVDELICFIRAEVPWCMLFLNDIVLIEESSKGINQKFGLWRNIQ